MTYKFSNLFKPTPIKMKVLGKALASAAASAALLNTVNGGNVKISVALIAAAFLGTFLLEFFADAKPDVIDVAEKAVNEVQQSTVYKQEAPIAGLPSNVGATITDTP